MGTLLVLYSLTIPEGNWNLNPLWILLFARVQGIAFSTVHATSVYGIAFIAGYLAIRDRATVAPYKWILIIFGSAGLHEWALYSADWILKGSLVSAYADAIWFAAFIGLAIVVANPIQRRYLFMIGLAMILFEFAYVGFFSNSDLQEGQYSLSAISDNMMEVFSWLMIPLAWSLYEQKKIS